jgi:hypothetical protein
VSKRSPYRGRRQPEWARWPDDELLDLRFRDLGLRFEDTVFPERLDRLHRELGERDIRLRPHAWLSDEWFSPDGVPGIAIPFFLAHPRLAKLEDRMMLEVEGANERWFHRLLRHEAGHAIDSGYRLHRRKLWRDTFGSFATPYPDHYRAEPGSRNFVRHLDAWYAQSHPAEDFAETFAVWLRPGYRWRKTYLGWPAMRKLRAVDSLMKDVAGRTPPVRSRRRPGAVSRNGTTLREHYERKRSHYGSEFPTISDPALYRLFSANGGRRRASAFLRRSRASLRRSVARGTGQHPYTVDQILNDMIGRCRELELVLDRPEEEVRMDAVVLLTVRTMAYVSESGRPWIPL